MNRFSISIVSVVLMLGGLVYAQAFPDTIAIVSDNLLPEGIEWDFTREQFLVGSWTQGNVFAVDDDGTLTPILETDGLHLINGIHVDNQNERLLVSNTDTDAPIHCPDIREAMAFTGVGIYDLVSGEQIDMVDLTGLVPDRGSLINDLTSDVDGNIYATDWCGSALYKIDADGNASVLIDDDSYYFETELGAGAFNGIDWHPDNYLIVSGGFGNPLYKVTLNDPISITAIELDAPAFADGITMLPNGDIAVIGVLFSEEAEFGFFSTTMRFTSEDDWQSASLVTNVVYDRFATTGVLRDDTFYVIQSGVIEPLPVDNFEILRVDIGDVSQVTDDFISPIDTINMFPNQAQRISVSTFIEAIELTGIDAFIAEQELVTVFVPSNTAFRSLATELGITVDELLEDTDTLSEILLYHIIVGQQVTIGDLSVSVDTNFVMANGQSVIARLVEVNGVVENGQFEDSQGRLSFGAAGTTFDNGVRYSVNIVMLPDFED